MLSELAAAGFWLDLAEITGINILLSGDNAVVIALACRSLPERQRNRAVIGGSAGAILLRVLFCLIVVWLLRIPYLKLIGGLLLVWIGVKLILPETNDHGGGLTAKANLWGAVQTIIIADAVMSLDNVVAIAAVARDSVLLIVSRPADQRPADRVRQPAGVEIPAAVPAAGNAGRRAVGLDCRGHHQRRCRVAGMADADPDMLEMIAKPLLAVLVMAIGTILARRIAARPKEVVDLAAEERK